MREENTIRIRILSLTGWFTYYHVLARFNIQLEYSKEWCDAINSFFIESQESLIN